MKSVTELFLGFLRYLGLLDEHPLIRKNIKRNRVFDDFSSDEETPVLGYKQLKKFRWSDVEAIDNHDKAKKLVRTVQEQTRGSTSTPKESSKRTVPVDLTHVSRIGPSTPRKTTPVTDGFVDLEQPKVALVDSKSDITNRKAPILHVDLDDDDNDEVVFVKEVATPADEPLEPFQEKNSHPCVNDKLLSKVLEAINSDDLLEYRELLQQIANTITPMSKDKPVGHGKLARNTAIDRLSQKTHINVSNEIELDSKLNTDRHQNAPQDRGPIRVSLTDSSDSDDDVQIVSASETTTSIKTNSARDLKELSRKWLLELNSIYNNKQQNDKVNDARQVSDITSKVNSDQNIALTHGHDETDTSEELLSKLASDYNIRELHSKPKIQKTQEKHNESRRASDITPSENSGQNQASSSNRETIGDWLARIEAKYFSTLSKTPDMFEVPQVDTVQKDARESPLESTKKWLKGLEAEYFMCQKTQENVSNAYHDSNNVPKVNSEQIDVDNLNTSRVLALRKGSEYKTDCQKTQEKNDDARRKSDTRSIANSEENEARSYLPAASRDWLSQLDAKYKTTPQKNQENLDIARKKLNKVSEVNVEYSESRSLKPDSTDDWLEELRSRYNQVHRKKQEELNDANRESNYENIPFLYKPDTIEERPSQIASNHKTQQPKTQEQPNNAHQEGNNLSETNSTQNESRTLKFNTSEELLSKLGSLYNKYQQETQENTNKSKDESAVETQSNDLPVLTPEQDELVDTAFEVGPEDELLIEKFNMRIHRRDLQTLSDLNWLNDSIINFYMNLIMQRSEERKDLPKVYATNTFFYPKLMQSGQAGLKRWTRKVDIFAYDLFVVPVNIGHHWCLSIVDFRVRFVKYLDSQGVPNQECLDALMKYLKHEHQDKKGAPFDDKGWKMERVTEIPQQKNGSDCGMFACTFAEFSSRDAGYSFTQAHMPYLRRKAALEILTGKLLL